MNNEIGEREGNFLYIYSVIEYIYYIIESIAYTYVTLKAPQLLMQ